MADCPKCDDQPLNHLQLDPGLPGYVCTRCNGALLSLVSYRAWSESQPDPVPSAEDISVNTADSRVALQCPKCNRLMTKYQVRASAENRLDYCSHCEEVWLDAGEWKLLHSLAMDKDITRIFTQPWQRRIVKEKQARLADARHAETFGGEWEKIRDLQAWLADHPLRHEILAFLMEDH